MSEGTRQQALYNWLRAKRVTLPGREVAWDREQQRNQSGGVCCQHCGHVPTESEIDDMQGRALDDALENV